MAETQSQPTETDSNQEPEKTSRYRSFVTNHPRTARALAITGAAVGAVATVAVAVALNKKDDTDTNNVVVLEAVPDSTPETA